ncbi:MAG: ribosomal protein S18-alanine N-acetyltransferase [Thermoproteales archaeon]|nr:ribosomal protein S18-alanine N-acetyltransferase [Thermoproteales archaeon]RLE66176.1 MAG: ribosomal-protein-alanine N-acetyltransferase [Thermoprotei archaeon]
MLNASHRPLFFITEARREDLKEIYKIERESFKDPYPLNILTVFLFLAPDLFLVAKTLHDRKVIGYIIGMVRRENVGHIVSLAVQQNFRRKGVASKLIEELIKKFKKKSLSTVRLEVRLSNIPARRLYLKHGFMESYIIHGYYGDGEPCITMFRFLE